MLLTSIWGKTPLGKADYITFVQKSKGAALPTRFFGGKRTIAPLRVRLYLIFFRAIGIFGIETDNCDAHSQRRHLVDQCKERPAVVNIMKIFVK